MKSEMLIMPKAWLERQRIETKSAVVEIVLERNRGWIWQGQ